MIASHHLLSAQYSETNAVPPRAEYPFPLAEEVVRILVRPDLHRQLTVWTRGYLLRGPPWQEVVEAELDAERPRLLLERFAGLTFGDVVRNLASERWRLPAPAWYALALQLCAAARRVGEHWLREPPCPAGIGWTLTGELVLAPIALNTIWATSRDVADHTVCFAPEHLHGAPLGERAIVFQLATLLTWLSCGEHPLGGGGDHLLALSGGAAPGRPWKRSVPSEVVPVLERASALNPAERFGSIDALEAALRSSLPIVAASARETFSVLEAATHRLVDRLIAELWTHDALLPATWDGLWPASLHPLEGLAVVEDGLLERRVDRRSFERWSELPTPPSWPSFEQRLRLSSELRRVDERRWWSLPSRADP